MSDSGEMRTERPFYAAHADAYDLLITDPVEPWAEAVHERLPGPARILDAGCGTGRHAAALIARGHEVDLVDASAQLLAIARRRCPMASARLADLCTLQAGPTYDAVTCRGVLNDLLTDRDRSAAVGSLAQALISGGRLLLDVREKTASRVRADGITRSRTVTVGPAATLTFTATTTWRDGLLHVHEQYSLTGAPPTAYDFKMRPWTQAELTDRLHAAGLQNVETRPGVGRKTPDRLFVTAVRRGS
jgi:SAM-dependent methyltransferase